MKFHVCLAACMLLTPALAKEVAIVLPEEKVSFKPGPGAELAQANCLTCHSSDYPLVQPAMPRKFWEGTIKKMREKYGAPVAETDVAPLVDYLTTAYGKPEK